MLKKITALSVSMMMLLSAVLVSCGEEASAPPAAGGTSAPEASPETTAAETEAETAPESVVPDQDLEGYTYVILERKNAANIVEREGDREEMDGDILNDAIYTRNRAIEERFNAKIKSATVDDVQAPFTKSVKAGDKEYSMVFITPPASVSDGIDGYNMNLWEIPGMDLTQPWYNDVVVNNFTVRNKLYSALSDMTYGASIFACCMFYNTNLCDKYGIEQISETVKKGQWTQEKELEISKGISSDINGDGKMDTEDFYGHVAGSTHNCMNYQYDADIPYLKINNEEGTYEVAIMSERLVKTVERINALLWEDNRSLVTDKHIDMFKNGQALFITGGYVGTMLLLRDMEDDFVPLTYPKFDEAQEKYLSMLAGSTSFIVIPGVYADDPATLGKIGTLTEALSEYSYNNLTPVIYDTVIENKTSRDYETTKQMLDIIRDGRMADFGYLTDKNSYMSVILTNCLDKKTNDVASMYAKKIDKVTKFYDKLFENFA